VDDGGDGRDALTAAGLTCGSCGTYLPATAKFCSECGSPAGQATQSAEYKQVTVLFADVVHSMEMAAKVGAERLREIMTELVNRSAGAVQRYGGTASQFTGDGIMAVFGAPVALEDHAVRACLAALGVQEEAQRLASHVNDRDAIDLRLRVGLNSGQVIAGEIGSGPFGYTAIGEQVGMAQRMESVAPAGGVMLSASTARLVEGVAVLGEPEMATIKGTEEPVSVRLLLSIGDRRRVTPRSESNLVGRQWEMSAVEALLDRAVDGRGAVVGVVGPTGIGKSRLVREVSARAATLGVDVFTVFCESHADQIPFYAVTRLLRAVTGVDGLDLPAARAHVRAQAADADPEDLLLFDDLLGIRDADAPVPNIDPDARRRRLTALVNAAQLSRQAPAAYVIEDAHWIDAVSESMLADFLTVIPQTSSLVIVTYRPEYDGALSRVHGAQTVALATLSDSETGALVSQLLGSDESVIALSQTITERASGTPFFAEEIVRELAERGILRGMPGAYVSTAEAAEVTVPATLQATIAARIDRLEPSAKLTLGAAAVIGSRFRLDLLAGLLEQPVVDDLVAAQLIDQVTFTRKPEYVFRHPLIRRVAYESQLKSDRAELHRGLAELIQARDPESVDESAALIAEHLEAAGELRRAYEWHMRAGAWSANRVVEAAMVSWQRARKIADALPSEDVGHTEMRIAPRTLMCLNAFRVNTNRGDVSFEELRELCIATGDKASLAIAMAGLVAEHMIYGRVREASLLASDVMALAEQIGDPELIIGMSMAAIAVKIVTGEMAEVLRFAQRAIDLAEGDPTKGNFIGLGSPLPATLASRGVARFWLGLPGWRDDFAQAVAMSEGTGPLGRSIIVYWAYGLPTVHEVLATNDSAVREIAEALQIAQQCADDIALGVARTTMAHVLLHQHSPADRERGLKLLEQVGEMCRQGRYYQSELPLVSMYAAYEMAKRGDRQSAIPLLRVAVDDLFSSGQLPHCLLATRALVEILVERQDDGEVAEAEAAVERLAAAPAEDGLVIRDIWLLRLRAVLARARGDTAAYRDYRDRHRDMARSFGFEGHMEWADAMA
jgi:class 3 adenylate cyclase